MDIIPTNFSAWAQPLRWEIVSSRVRKDIVRKPSNGGAQLKANWSSDVDKGEVTVEMTITVTDKGLQTPIELGSVTIRGTFGLKDSARFKDHMELPHEIVIRIGQTVYDTARGVLLAKSSGTPIGSLVLPEVLPHLFLPPGYSGTSLN